jgi:4-amino-4-deoxy-L-arabinose transferase-like glycosyltransferase
LLRIVTYYFLAPENNDSHGSVVQFLVDHHTFPLVGQEHEAHNPPLYYLLAAPILAWTGSMKAVQSLSLIFSLATLWILLKLIYDSGLIPNPSARFYTALLVCLLPQFLFFSLYVSNDGLAILIGATLSLLTWRYVRDPSWKQLLLLALTLALGLLTKTTFVAAFPVLLALVFWHPREKRRGWTGLLRADVFLIIVVALGSYKFLDNAARYRDPFYNNMSTQEGWHLNHMQTYRGFWSFADINIGRLLISPTVSPTTAGSYPVLLYGTFWYQHIPESNLIALTEPKYRYLGSAVFLIALIPTWFFLTGLGKLALGLPALLQNFDASCEDDLDRLTISVLAMILVSALALLCAAGWQYREWSIFQGRFLFPWFFAGLAAFSAGVPVSSDGAMARILRVGMAILVGLFALYLAAEFARVLWPGPRPLPQQPQSIFSLLSRRADTNHAAAVIRGSGPLPPPPARKFATDDPPSVAMRREPEAPAPRSPAIPSSLAPT